VVFWKRKRPEPARAEASASSGEAIVKAGSRVWLVTLFDREGQATKHIVTTELENVFGDGWKKVTGSEFCNVYMRTSEKGLEVLQIMSDGRVVRHFFGAYGDILERTYARISKVEVVG